MKRPLLILSAVAAITFVGCDNENTTNPEPLGTVTIKGAIVADLDQDDKAGEPYLEKVPADVPVRFVDNNGAELGKVKTTADGYTIDLQIGAPKDITIVVGDFQTTINVDPDGDKKFEKLNALYNENPSDFVTVEAATKGSIYIRNVVLHTPETLDF